MTPAATMQFADLPREFLGVAIEWKRPTDPQAILGLYLSRFMLASFRCQLDANIAIDPPVARFVMFKREMIPAVEIQGRGPLSDLEREARAVILELSLRMEAAAALVVGVKVAEKASGLRLVTD